MVWGNVMPELSDQRCFFGVFFKVKHNNFHKVLLNTVGYTSAVSCTCFSGQFPLFIGTNRIKSGVGYVAQALQQLLSVKICVKIYEKNKFIDFMY